MTKTPKALAAEQIKAAAERTREAGTVRLFSAAREGSALGDDVSRIEGVADLANRVARATVHHMTPERQSEMEGKLNEPVEDAEDEEARVGAQAFMKMFSMSLENAYVGGATYTRVRDEGWADFSGADRDGARSVDDPLWLLDALLGVRDDTTELGADEVRDVPTTHYRLTIDLASADEQLPTGIMAPGPRAYRSLRELPAEVWVDEQGLIRRMSYECAGPGKGGYWQTTELWDFGLDVEIEVPSSDELIAPSCAIDPGAAASAQQP